MDWFRWEKRYPKHILEAIKDYRSQRLSLRSIEELLHIKYKHNISYGTIWNIIRRLDEKDDEQFKEAG